MTGPEPRPYQQTAHDQVWARFDSGDPSTLAVMPTGTGKTIVAAMSAATARDRGTKTLFLAHREILINQARDTLAACGLDVAVEMGGQDAREQGSLYGEPDVVVATVQTLQGDRLRRWDRRHFGHIITDECHRAAAAEHRNVYDWFNGALHLGITATPDGASGKIGNVYKSLAYHYCIRQAVLEGYLVPIRHEKCKVAIDLKDLKITGGDFNAGDLANRIGPKVEYIADAIKQRIEGRAAVVFAPTVASAMAIAQAIGAQSPSGLGLSCMYVAGDSGGFGIDRRTRLERLRLFSDGQYQVIVCCDLLFEGWDARHVGAVVVARPTLVRYRYAQMVGRGTRICPEIRKADCLVVDFDWQAGGASRDLITPIELFAEDDPDLIDLDEPRRKSVVDDAKRILQAGESDPQKALERAKDANLRSASLPIVLTGIRAEFEVESYDPLSVAGLAGVKLKNRSEVWKPNAGYEPAREWQKKKLTALGVKEPEKLTFFGAHKMIRALEKRRKDQLATLPQIRELLRLGVGEINARVVTTTQASRLIEELRLSLREQVASTTEAAGG